MKPSDVPLAIPPLVGTLGSAEVEHAAALLVRACQYFDDRFQPIGPKQIGIVLDDDLKNGREPLTSLSKNPFFRPDFHQLVANGFAKGDIANHGALELTDEALERLGRSVR